mgnify:CR=1 FL=1
MFCRLKDFRRIATRYDKRADIFPSAVFLAAAIVWWINRVLTLGKPVQNAFVESFNGKFRDECLKLHWLRPLRHAREEIGRWKSHCNTKRPHSVLGYLFPTKFLIKATAPALETLAVSTLPLNTETQPGNSRSNRI